MAEHVSPRYVTGDWFATSLITKTSEENSNISIETLNSFYLVDSATIIDIPSAAITSIRMGTPPLKALALIKGELYSE